MSSVHTSQVYEEYQAELTRVQAVDFDDILLSGLKLFEDHGHHLLSNIRRWSRSPLR